MIHDVEPGYGYGYKVDMILEVDSAYHLNGLLAGQSTVLVCRSLSSDLH